MRDILNSYTTTELRKFISNFNKSLGAVRGYSKMKKAELIDLMTKKEHIDKFKSIKMKPKTERKKPEKKTTTTTKTATKTTTKTQPKKETTTTPKEQPKKEEPKEKSYLKIMEEEVEKYNKTNNNAIKKLKQKQPFKFKSYNKARNFRDKIIDEINEAVDKFRRNTQTARKNLSTEEYNKFIRQTRSLQNLYRKEDKKLKEELKKLKIK